jgi:hypothetical protein
MVLESNNIQLIGLEPSQITTQQTQPKAPVRCRCNLASGRHLRFRKFILHFKIADPKEASPWTNGLRPNVLLAILCDANDESERAPIPFRNAPKLPLFVDEKRIVYSDPESTGMIFKQRCNLISWKALV